MEVVELAERRQLTSVLASAIRIVISCLVSSTLWSLTTKTNRSEKQTPRAARQPGGIQIYSAWLDCRKTAQIRHSNIPKSATDCLTGCSVGLPRRLSFQRLLTLMRCAGGGSPTTSRFHDRDTPGGQCAHRENDSTSCQIDARLLSS